MTKEKAPDLPPDFDPAKPLANDEHETFVQARLADMSGKEAYKLAKGGKIRLATAEQQASRWGRSPQIAARLQYLRLEAAKAGKSAKNASQTQVQETPRRKVERTSAPAPTSSPSAEAMSRAELYALITAEIRAGRVDPALVSSLLKVAPELGEVDQSRPDPTAVISYVCSFAGRPGDEIARELGGLEYIADKLCSVLKVNPLDLASVLTSKGHTKGHNTQDTQAGNESRLISNITQEQDEQPKAGNTGGEGGQGGAAC